MYSEFGVGSEILIYLTAALSIYLHSTTSTHQKPNIQHRLQNMPKEFKMPTMERFRMLKAKRKRLREEQEAMDGRVDPILRTHPSSRTLTLSEVMNCSSQFPHPAKRVCVDVASTSVRVLKEEDPAPVPVNACIGSTEVSKC